MILDELVALLSFDIDDKNLKAFNQKIGEGITLVAGFSATIAAAGGTLFAMAKATAEAGENASNMAQKFGISAQAFQELQYAARGEADALAGSMTFLTKSAEAASQGSKEQVNAFKKLGVQYKDTNGKLIPLEDMIMKVSDGMNKMQDGPEKAALAMDLFGKSGTELIPFLNKGSKEIEKMREEAREMGYVLDEEAIQNSGAFNDALADLGNMLRGIRNTIGAGLLPIFIKLGDRLKDFLKANRAIITTRLDKFFKILADYAERGWHIMTALWDAANGLAEIFGGLENVLKMVAYAMTLFASAKILLTIGQMVQLVNKLGTAFTIANAKALLIPILIGAAVVALGLIIEDIVAFFQGKDSVTGIIVEKFKNMFKYLEGAFMGMSGWVKSFVAVLLTPLRALINTFQNVIDLISVVRGKMSLGDFAKNMGGRLLNTFDMSGRDGLKSAIGLGRMSNLASASQAASISPTQSDFVSPANQSNQNNIDMPITVNVGQGTNPFEAARAVKGEMTGGLDSVLRGTKRSFSSSKGAQ